MRRTHLCAVALGLVLAWAGPASAQPYIRNTGSLGVAEAVARLDTHGMGTATVEVKGTFTGTITFELIGGGATPVGVDCETALTPGTAVNTTTTTGTWRCPVAGYAFLQARMSAYTDGTALVYLEASAAGGSSGGGGGGSSFDGVLLDAAGGDAVTDTANNAIRVNVVTGGGTGGTSVNEDVASADAHPGTPAYTVRNNTLTGATGADGDYQPSKSTAAGAIYIAPTFGDTVAATSNGGVSAQTQRVTIANDSTGVLATVSTVTNLNQFAGAAIPMTTTQADDLANTLDSLNVSAFLYGFDGSTWDRLPGTSALGLTVNSEMPAAAALADNTATPTVPAVGAFNMCYDGSTWDFCRAATVTEVTEDVAETAAAVGTYAMTVRRDTAASSAGTTGDNSTLNTNNVGALWVSQVDPCSSEAKLTTPISLTTDTVIIAAVASKKNYICAISIVAGAAEIVSITEGTGSVCATSEAALMGSTTDANGASFAANGGMAAIGSNSTVIAGITANVDTCLNVSGSNRVSGFVTYVQR